MSTVIPFVEKYNSFKKKQLNTALQNIIMNAKDNIMIKQPNFKPGLSFVDGIMFNKTGEGEEMLDNFELRHF